MYKYKNKVFTPEAWTELLKLKPDLRFEPKELVFYHTIKHEPIVDQIDVMVYGLDVVKSSHDIESKH